MKGCGLQRAVDREVAMMGWGRGRSTAGRDRWALGATDEVCLSALGWVSPPTLWRRWGTWEERVWGRPWAQCEPSGGVRGGTAGGSCVYVSLELRRWRHGDGGRGCHMAGCRFKSRCWVPFSFINNNQLTECRASATRRTPSSAKDNDSSSRVYLSSDVKTKSSDEAAATALTPHPTRPCLCHARALLWGHPALWAGWGRRVQQPGRGSLWGEVP